MASATSLSYPDGYGLRTGPQLRRPLVCGSVCAVLFSVLALATLIHLGLLARIRRSRSCSSGRLRSTLLSFVQVTVLWPLDRRERRTPWLLAAAFLWGGCIATAIALPFNTAIFKLVD
jgi:hypothetical protein